MSGIEGTGREAERRMDRALGRWDAMLRAARATVGMLKPYLEWDGPDSARELEHRMNVPEVPHARRNWRRTMWSWNKRSF